MKTQRSPCRRLGLTAEVVDELTPVPGLAREAAIARAPATRHRRADRVAVTPVMVTGAGRGRAHSAHGAGFVLVVLGGAARRDIAEAPAMRAQGTAEEERRLAVLPVTRRCQRAGLRNTVCSPLA